MSWRADVATIIQMLEGDEKARKRFSRKPHKCKQGWVQREMGLSGQNQVKGAILALKWMVTMYERT